MAYSKNDEDKHLNNLTTAKKRRIRKKKSRILRTQPDDQDTSQPAIRKQQNIKQKSSSNNIQKIFNKLNAQSEQFSPDIETVADKNIKCLESRASEVKDNYSTNMSSNETPSKSREEILAEREAKKFAKQNAKMKPNAQKTIPAPEKITTVQPKSDASLKISEEKSKGQVKVSSPPKGKDEVDKATVRGSNVSVTLDAGDTSKEQIKADRAAKKIAKQAKKKGTDVDTEKSSVEITNKAVAKTLSNIVEVAKDVQEVTAKQEEEGKSKAELKAERRAKQEAQRAAKQVQAKPAAKLEAKPANDLDKTTKTVIKEKSPKPKSVEKPKAKSQIAHGVNWFQHLYTEQGKDALKKPILNSNLHPAIIKLGVQLRTRVVSGSNARCIALLDALKKMVRDYSLPARTEFARGLEAHLAASLAHVWAQRPPAAAMTNAVKYFRYHLTQLSNNVSDFEAKKILQGEIDRYIREQIDMAGEAISIAVRNKISSGDTILTYGCSSLIERILVEAHCAGLVFRAVVAGGRVSRAREMLRRLAAAGVPCQHVDLAAVSHVMKDVNKVLLGAGSLLANGSVLGAVGTCQVALAARRHNLPVLVCCETHKFSERVQTDAFVYNELGDPDDLIAGFEDSPLKEWRSNPNLTLLNLTYDVTPPSLVTAVVTELAILPCTSAPVVLRFKLSEYAV